MKEDKKYLGYFIWIIFFMLMATLIFNVTTKIKNHNLEIEKQKNELEVDSVPQEKIEEDTTIVLRTKSNPWPIKIVSVIKNTDEFIDFKWQVFTENGVMYYTNETVYVGQIAFYINDEDEIVNYHGKNKLDPREWR